MVEALPVSDYTDAMLDFQFEIIACFHASYVFYPSQSFLILWSMSKRKAPDSFEPDALFLFDSLHYSIERARC